MIIHHVGVMLKALMLSPLCFGSLYDFGGLVLVIQEYACVTCVSHFLSYSRIVVHVNYVTQEG